jgi:hypothetical protein
MSSTTTFEPRSPIEFHGHDRCHAQRLALNWWFEHRDSLGLGLRAFFHQCSVSPDQRTITFVWR